MTSSQKVIDFISPRQKQIGEIGIEVEVEGKYLNKKDTAYWRVHTDGSLRGESAEYVLAQPCLRDEYRQALNNLWEHMTSKENSYIKKSDRCGIHIHINVQQLTTNQVYRFILLYLLYEPLLIEFCDASRNGNLFCMKASDADRFLISVREAIQKQDIYYFDNDHLRYAAINLCALLKYGSLEFRALETPNESFEKICSWIDILLSIRDKSMKFSGRKEMLNSILSSSFSNFMKSTFNIGIYSLLAKENQEEILSESLENIRHLFTLKIEEKKSPRRAREGDIVDRYSEMLDSVEIEDAHDSMIDEGPNDIPPEPAPRPGREVRRGYLDLRRARINSNTIPVPGWRTLGEPDTTT